LDPTKPDGYCYVDVFKTKGRVLYALPDVLEARKVYLVEGEQDAETLLEQGVTATTYPGGANFHADETPGLLTPLTGKDVVLVPDNDEPGRRMAARLTAALKAIAKTVARVDLPGTPEHEDVTWWLNDGQHTVGEFLALPEVPLWPPLRQRPYR